MKFSHSKIECFNRCKYRFKLRYIDRWETISPTKADDPRIVGKAFHTGVEEGLSIALKEYAASYPIITDAHIDEMIKLEIVIDKVTAMLPVGGQFEVPIVTKYFLGVIDYLLPVEGDERRMFDIYDFKYSNNIPGYLDSDQLHVYKFFFERNGLGQVRNMYFLFAPKCRIRKRRSDDVMSFRKRIREDLRSKEPRLVEVKYDSLKVTNFLMGVRAIRREKEYKANQFSRLCEYCEYNEYCQKGWDYFMYKLPVNKRREKAAVTRHVMWIYGAPFCGKTTFANEFPDPLMLNTDGNIRYVDAQYIRIRDEVTQEGKITKRQFAWSIFKDVIASLEASAGTNGYRTIVVDLLEDTYEYCRVYMYNKLGITHESDDPFKSWDMVRGEFLNTLKRLMNLDYENIILISHEDASKDITRKGGDKVTAIKPNIPDKVAVKVAGMVDVVARIVADGDSRRFVFKNNENIFGGGRLKVTERDIALNVDELFRIYDEANADAPEHTEKLAERESREAFQRPQEAFQRPQAIELDKISTEEENPQEERPRRRRRE